MRLSAGSAIDTKVSVKAVAGGVATAMLAMVLAATCNFPPSFGDEYRDSSVNFIADRVLTEPPDATIDDITVPLDALAIWDWGWRWQTGNTYQYMDAIDQGAAVGLAGGGNAWLLEAVNLADNPAFADDTTGWNFNGAAISRIAAIHGNALQITPGTLIDYGYIVPNLFFDDIAVATLAHAYTLSMNSEGTTGLSGLRYIETIPPYTIDSLQPAGWTGSGPFSISISGVSAPYTHTLAFTHTDSPFRFDDISAIRTDILPLKWSLVIRLGLTDTEPALVPGMYSFAVYARRPATHSFTTDAGRGDSLDYASRFVTLRMTQIAGGTTQTVAVQSFDISTLPDTWNLLELRMPSDSNFTFPETTSGGAIELSISPMNPSLPEAGAVLIANPSLHFHIDGY